MISPNRKKRMETVDAENLETTFNEDNDEDDDTMDKKREEFEYSFIGTPVNQDIKVEDEDETNEEQSKEEEEEEEERTEDNDQKKKKKKVSTQKLPTGKISTTKSKKRRKQIVESDDDDSDIEIDEAEPSLKKITRNYITVPEKKYVLEKVFRTFHFLFPESYDYSDQARTSEVDGDNQQHQIEVDREEQNDLTASVHQEQQQPLQNIEGDEQQQAKDSQQETLLYENETNQYTSMAEVATKTFFHRQMERKSREHVFKTFPVVLSKAVLDTVQQSSQFPLSISTPIDCIMDQYLQKLRFSFHGPLQKEDELFGCVKERVYSMNQLQLKLQQICAIFPFSSTPFTTEVMYDFFFYESFFDMRNKVTFTFLQPFNSERMVSFDTNIPKERFDQEVKSIFSLFEATKREEDNHPLNRFWYLIKEQASFYQSIFLCNNVISGRNLVQLPSNEFIRIKFYEQEKKMYIEEQKFDKLFKLTTADKKVQVSPFSTESGYPHYHDYFRFTTPVTMKECKDFGFRDLHEIAAYIIGIDSEFIHIPKHQIGEDGEQWFYCSNRLELFKAVSVPSNLFVVDSENEEESDGNDEELSYTNSKEERSDSDSEDEASDNNKKNEEKEQSQEEVEDVRQNDEDDYTFCRMDKNEENQYEITTVDEEGNMKTYKLTFGIIQSPKDILYYHFDEKVYDIVDFHHQFIHN